MLHGNGRKLFRIENKVVIVTIGAAEVALGQENDRGYLAWPVDERRFDKSFNGKRHVLASRKRCC
jgi:hypothetical protein